MRSSTVSDEKWRELPHRYYIKLVENGISGLDIVVEDVEVACGSRDNGHHNDTDPDPGVPTGSDGLRTKMIK